MSRPIVAHAAVVESLEGVSQDVIEAIYPASFNCLTETSLPMGKKYNGKVRDTYDIGDKLVIITSDRQSAFDRVLAAIPFKGQVLNQTSAWWFKNTSHIVQNAVISYPDPNVVIQKKCKVFPVEFVCRGYMTGSTDTSLWTHYAKGEREYCGNVFPDGMKKNDKLVKNVITPTTKAESHDAPITPAEIVSTGLMSQKDWDEASGAALRLFEFGQQEALKRGLLLVDTKYEFGKGDDGTIYIIDEVHTPDSSRYWMADSYESRHKAGQEPQNIDKEFLRLWFRERCDPYADKVLPEAPKELVCELSKRYVYLFERITGEKFVVPSTDVPLMTRIEKNVTAALS